MPFLPPNQQRQSTEGKPYNIKMQVMFVVSDDFLFFSFSLRLPGRDANP